MQTQRFRFQRAIEDAKESSLSWLKEEYKAILESDKEFTYKADLIAKAITSLDARVAMIDQELVELQTIKSSLKLAKELSLKVGAEVFASYGIEKLEGLSISSITIQEQSIKEKFKVELLNEEEAIKMGYYNVSVDYEKLKEDLLSIGCKHKLLGIASLHREQVHTPAKLKINKRRAKATPNDEILQLGGVA